MTRQLDGKFEAVLRDHLGLLPADAVLTPDTDLGTYGLDSLASIQLLVTLEDTYDITIPDELLTAEMFASAGSLWRAVSALRDAREGEPE